ncbi:MAG TPA: TIGR01777 family oxidoreductase, partial [Byssovorax sp.]
MKRWPRRKVFGNQRAMKRVLVTGGSGFIGRKLCADLVARGDQVTVLTRDVAATKRILPGSVRVAAWSLSAKDAWAEELGVVDAVMHLAGENVAERWTYERKRAIVTSRVDATHALVEAMRAAKHKPAAFVSASAIGYYGPRPGDEELDEQAEPGEGFLADVTQRWEAASKEAEAIGVRSVQVRIGLVLGEGGGVLEKLVTPFKVFAGGPLGDGKQVFSWIHRDDVVGILLLALDD